MSGILFDQLHQGLGDVLDLRSQQHGLTVSNLANADTPEYLAREIDFSGALDAAMESGGGLELRRTRAEHHGMQGTPGQDPEILQKEAPASALNGNSVNPDAEVTKLVSNRLMYSAIANGMSRRLAILRYAASNGKT